MQTLPQTGQGATHPSWKGDFVIGRRIEISLIDNDPHRRAAITHQLTRHGFYVEPFEDLNEASTHWANAEILLVYDHHNEIEFLINRMVAEGSWSPIVGFAEQPKPLHIVDAIHKGAVAFLAWPFTTDEIESAFLLARRYSHEMMSAGVRRAMARSLLDRLTAREREVLQSVVDGLTNREAGARMMISPRTVEIHRSNMMRKLGTRRTAEAIRIALDASESRDAPGKTYKNPLRLPRLILSHGN